MLRRISDLVTANGRTKFKVEWTLSLKKVNDEICEYSNHIL